MCYPDKSLEEEPLFPAFAGHVPWPCHAFPELLCTVVSAANVLQSCKPRSVSSHHCMLQWGCGVHTAPAHCPHEWSTGNAAGEQYRGAPMQPSGKGLVFHASTLIPLLQAGCSCGWCLQLQHPRLLLITWQGQLLVNAGVSLSSCLACCKPLFPGHTQQCLPGVYHYGPLCCAQSSTALDVGEGRCQGTDIFGILAGLRRCYGASCFSRRSCSQSVPVALHRSKGSGSEEAPRQLIT